MLNLKLGDKMLQIKFGYEATVRSGLIKKMVQAESSNENEGDSVQATMELLPEMILVGAQKYHRDEFGYNYLTGEGKDEKLSEVYSLIDDYLDQDDATFEELLGKVKGEMLEDGFLSKLFQKEKKKEKKNAKIKDLEN